MLKELREKNAYELFKVKKVGMEDTGEDGEVVVEWELAQSRVSR